MKIELNTEVPPQCRAAANQLLEAWRLHLELIAKSGNTPQLRRMAKKLRNEICTVTTGKSGVGVVRNGKDTVGLRIPPSIFTTLSAITSPSRRYHNGDSVTVRKTKTVSTTYRAA